jgi:hypothetical protein
MGQPVRGNFYAGFELELAGAERPLKQSETATSEGVSIRRPVQGTRFTLDPLFVSSRFQLPSCLRFPPG